MGALARVVGNEYHDIIILMRVVWNLSKCFDKPLALQTGSHFVEVQRFTTTPKLSETAAGSQTRSVFSVHTKAHQCQKHFNLFKAFYVLFLQLLYTQRRSRTVPFALRVINLSSACWHTQKTAVCESAGAEKDKCEFVSPFLSETNGQEASMPAKTTGHSWQR